MTDSIAFRGFRHSRLMQTREAAFVVEHTSATTWTPLADVGQVSILLLPGSYDGATGVWTDQSGFAWGVTSTGASIPTETSGFPTFTGVEQLTIAASFADSTSFPAAALSSPDNGSVVVIASYDNAIAADGGDYLQPAVIIGSAATPGIFVSDVGANCTGYDGAAYVRSIGNVLVQNISYSIFGKWSATGISVRVGATSFTAETPWTGGFGPLDVGNIGSTTLIGTSFAGGNPWIGKIKAIAVYPTQINNAKADQWNQWALGEGLV